MERPDESIEKLDESPATGNPMTKTGAKGAQRKAPPEPSDEAIRALAYELYERRGRSDGSEVDDWLAAERHLRDERHRARDEDLTEQV